VDLLLCMVKFSREISDLIISVLFIFVIKNYSYFIFLSVLNFVIFFWPFFVLSFMWIYPVEI